MKRRELEEYIEEYRDSNSAKELISVLKEKLVEEIEGMEISTDKQRHDLNLLIRDLEEELDYIESEKLSEYDPERQ